MNAVKKLIVVNLWAHVTMFPVVSAVHVHVAMSQTPVENHARTWMSVAMSRHVSMDVLTCLEDIAVSVPSALYNTSTGTNALVSTTANVATEFMSAIHHVRQKEPTVRKRHCAAAVSLQLQHLLKPAIHVLNRVFDSNIALIASFVTAVGNSNSY